MDSMSIGITKKTQNTDLIKSIIKFGRMGEGVCHTHSNLGIQDHAV